MNVEYKIPEIRCRVCKKELKKEDFQSTFSGSFHYKTITCSCGKETNIPVKFLGSGNHEWDGEIERRNAEEESIERKLMFR